MKLLFDQNISFRIVNKLNSYFPLAKHVSDAGLLDADDIDIWLYAQKENYTIVTFDSDYYDISLVNGCPPKIIWLRTGNLTTAQISNIMIDNFDRIKVFLNDEKFNDLACLEIE